MFPSLTEKQISSSGSSSLESTLELIYSRMVFVQTFSFYNALYTLDFEITKPKGSPYRLMKLVKTTSRISEVKW